MFSKVSIATVAALGLIAASPVLARGKNQDPSAAPAKEQSDAKTRYCVRSEPVTGSIRQGRVCKTAGEWREEGVDVAKLQYRN